MHLASLELLLQIQHNLVDSLQVLQKVFKSLDQASKSHQRGRLEVVFLHQSIFVELYAIAIGKFKCKTFSFENHDATCIREAFIRDMLQWYCCSDVAQLRAKKVWQN